MPWRTDLGKEIVEGGRDMVGDILGELQGRNSLWHRTGLDSLRDIIRDGYIHVNEGQYTPTTGHSARSYGRLLKSISLFDFDTHEVEPILFAASDWSPFLADLNPITIWIEIDRAKLSLELLDPPLGGPDRKRKHFEVYLEGSPYTPLAIPFVEAWYRASIPKAAFKGFIVFEWRERGKIGEWVPEGDGALAFIEGLADKWANC
jgi:hypothetical protein